jgi:hypothetical protein
MVTSRRRPGGEAHDYSFAALSRGRLDWLAVSAAVPTVSSELVRSQEDAVVELVTAYSKRSSAKKLPTLRPVKLAWLGERDPAQHLFQ